MNLITVEEIKRSIDALTPEQREELLIWIEECHFQHEVDSQIKAALDAGRFDDHIARAIADHDAGRTKPLP